MYLQETVTLQPWGKRILLFKSWLLNNSRVELMKNKCATLLVDHNLQSHTVAKHDTVSRWANCYYTLHFSEYIPKSLHFV